MQSNSRITVSLNRKRTHETLYAGSTSLQNQQPIQEGELYSGYQLFKKQRLSSKLQLAKDTLNKVGLLTPENDRLLMEQAEHAPHFLLLLHRLQQAGLLNQANYESLLKQAPYAAILSKVIDQLWIAGGSDYLDQNIYDAFIQQPQHALSLFSGLMLLIHKVHNAPKWVNQYRALLIKHAPYAIGLASTIMLLTLVGLLPSKKNLATLIKYRDFIPEILAALRGRATVHTGQKKFDAIIKHIDALTQPEQTDHVTPSDPTTTIISTLYSLRLTERALGSTETQTDLPIEHRWEDQSSPEIELIKQLLKRAGLLIPKNQNLLIESAPYAVDLYLVLVLLEQANLLNQRNYELLMQATLDASDLYLPLYQLGLLGALTQNTYEALISQAQDAYFVGASLLWLANANLCNRENCEQFIEHGLSNAEPFQKGLYILTTKNNLNQNTFEALIQQPQYAEELASGINKLITHGFIARNSEDRSGYQILLTQHAKQAIELSNVIIKFTTAGLLPNKTNLDTLIRYRDFLEEILADSPCNQAEFDETINTINARVQQEKIAFLSGDQATLEAESPLRFFFQSPICDVKALPQMIFDFLPTPRK